MALSRQVVAPYILRIKEFAIPKRKFIRLTYTLEKTNTLQIVILFEIHNKKVIAYDSSADISSKTGGKEVSHIKTSMQSFLIKEKKNAEDWSGDVQDLGDAGVSDLHTIYKYYSLRGYPMAIRTAEHVSVYANTDDGLNSTYDIVEECGFDKPCVGMLRDELYIDPISKRITQRIPMIDGWKLDIRYIGYN